VGMDMKLDAPAGFRPSCNVLGTGTYKSSVR
jgi:hypothetical protein